MMRQLGLLWLGSLGLWLVLAGGAWLIAGPAGVLDTAIACGLCLVPMTATLIWAHRAFGTAPDQQLLAALGGTGIRLVLALAGGIGLFHGVPALHRPAFLIWVIVFYLTTLTLEITLLVHRQNVLAAELPGRPQSSPTLTDYSGHGR